MHRALKAALVICAMANFGGVANAGILGDTVVGHYYYPTVGNDIQPLGSAVVGAGIEFTGLQGAANANFTDTQLIVTFIHNGLWANTVQNGPAFTDVTNQFTSVSIDTTTTTAAWFNAGMVSIDNTGTLIINWVDQTFATTDIIALDLVPGAIPEPMSMALLGGGLIGLSAFRRRKLGSAR